MRRDSCYLFWSSICLNRNLKKSGKIGPFIKCWPIDKDMSVDYSLKICKRIWAYAWLWSSLLLLRRLRWIEIKPYYITNLGFDAIWISPAVDNYDNGYHGYWARDIYKINDHFGGPAAFKSFVNTQHENKCVGYAWCRWK